MCAARVHAFKSIVFFFLFSIFRNKDREKDTETRHIVKNHVLSNTFFICVCFEVRQNVISSLIRVFALIFVCATPGARTECRYGDNDLTFVRFSRRGEKEEKNSICQFRNVLWIIRVQIQIQIPLVLGTIQCLRFIAHVFVSVVL